MRKATELAAVALVLATVVAASCGGSESGAAGGGGSATGGAHGGYSATGGFAASGGGTSGGTGGSSGTVGSGGQTNDAGAGTGGIWQPPGDPGWTAVSWRPADCDTEFATNVENAAPPIIWEDCGGSTLPGCQRLLPTWVQQVPVPDIAFKAPPQLYKAGSELRFSLHFKYGKTFDQRKVIYDENWKPLAAWREDPNKCGGNLLQWTPKHVCFAIGTAVKDTIQALLNLTDLTGPPLAVYESAPTIPLDCNTELFASITGGATVYLRDLASGSEFPQSPPAGGSELLEPRLVGEYALLPRIAAGANGPLIDGWIWKRPNTMEKLLDPGNEVIYDMRSDGTTLVWVQTQSKDILTTAPGDLWTSPFATTASGIQPQKRRTVPAIGLSVSMKGVGDGWYALVEQPVGAKDRYLHVYRLSDAHHWLIPTPSDVRPTDVVYIDSTEIWFTGMSTTDAYITLIRQKLSALGPGD